MDDLARVWEDGGFGVVADGRLDRVKAGRAEVDGFLASDAGSAFVANSFSPGLISCLFRLKKACGQDVSQEKVEWTVGFPDGVVADVTFHCLRIARNLCINEQVRPCFYGVIGPCVDLMGYLEWLHKGSAHKEWQALIQKLGFIMPQFLCNLCAQDDSARAQLWNTKNVFASISGLMSFANSSPCDFKTLQGSMCLLYASSLNNPVLLETISKDDHLVLTILASAVVSLNVLNGENENVDSHDPAIVDTHAYIVWLVGNLVNAGLGENLLKATQGTEKLQLALLSLWLGSRLEDEEQRRNGEVVNDSTTIEYSFVALETFYLSIVHKRRAGTVNDICSQIEQIALRLLGSYTTDSRVYLKNQTKGALINIVLDELDNATLNKETCSYGQRGDLLRVIANVCYKRVTNQNVVREHKNGLFVVLNQCNVDENSPYLREWAILAIRNLTEGNPMNQEVIANLRLNGTVQNSVIEKAGLKVEMTEDGKAKLTRM
mmetsp:Transcript_17454/g.28193  ORF Transcript_17454/g.28193 Transcript_17454/m.28193 type:complete len:490 (+) Transcript_17454:113-1582(+)